MTEPTVEQKKEQKFLEQQYTALRTEVENASERAFKIFAASVLVVPTGLSLGAAAGSNVLPLIKMLLPLLLLAFYAMYWAQIFSTRRTGLYIESHIEPSLLHRTRGWESWLSDRRYAYDAQMNVAFFLLAVVYYIGTVCVAVTAEVKESSALTGLTDFLNFANLDKPALLLFLPVPGQVMLFILYALAGLAIVFLVQLLPDRQLKEEERLEQVFRSKPVQNKPEEIQDRFLKNLAALQRDRNPNTFQKVLQKVFGGVPFKGIAPFTGLGCIKSYHCHTETSRHESKARHVRLTMKEVRKDLHTHDVITTAVGVLTWAGLLLWAVMPLQRLYMNPGGLRPTDPLPVSIALVLSLGALSVVLVALYYHLVGRNIGPKVDIRIRPDKETSESKETLYIVQTSLAIENATLDEMPEAWLKTMLELEEQATLDKVSEASLRTMLEREKQKGKSAAEEDRATSGTA